MSHTTWRRILWISTVAAIPGFLHAADGEILIDPSRVARGGITPGDAPGFPVTLSQPGRYRLMGNITVPDTITTAIDITADNVTLDLNGFSVIGPNVCTPCASGSGVGIHAGSFNTGTVAPTGIRVMNGTVRGMGFHGVRLMGTATLVEKVHAYSNGGPGIVVGGGRVIDSVVFRNGSTGIIGLIVRGNIASDNQGSGIYLRGPGGVATGNSVSSNGQYGIDAYCAGSIVGNALTGNQAGGVRTQGTAACAFADNAL